MRLFARAVIGLTVVLWLCCAAKAVRAQDLLPTPTPEAAANAATTIIPTQFLLVPGVSTSVKLHTHTADFRIGYDGNALIASLDARYRLQNESQEIQPVVLKLVTDPSAASTAPPANLVVMYDNEVLALTPDGDSLTAAIETPADATVEVQLSYAVNLGDGPLAELRYTLTSLRAWPGQPSVRVSMAVPENLPSTSWLQTSPSDWTFAPDELAGLPRLRWLFDAQLPQDPFVLRLLHPTTWQALQAAEAAATPGAPASAFAALGRLYQALYAAVAENEQRERFYAQAVAAYTAGIDNAGSAATAETALLHAGLATLYRSRSVAADGAVNRTYMTLMTSETNQALPNLPTDAPERAELVQWQIEGLTLQLNDARDRQDWPAAFTVLDQLQALPPDAVDANMVAEMRRSLGVQQALQLLEEGDSDAAMQLAGAQVTNADLLPPGNARPLFAAWQMTTTVSATQSKLVVTAYPVPERGSEAQAALETVLQAWRAAGNDTVQMETFNDAALGITAQQLQLALPGTTSGAELARAIPQGADWALLRALLTQLAPSIEQRPRGLHQQILLSQPLDLRSAGEEWNDLAATLDAQADTFDAQSPTINFADVSTVAAESALVVRVKAANYRRAALAWRTLARTSLVAVQLTAGGGVPTIQRTWLTTPETPLQVLTLEADVLSMSRLLVVAIGAFLGLFLLTGVLWWLL